MAIHVVQAGDTLLSIAQTYGVPAERIVRDNQLANPNGLVVGQALLILTPLETYQVVPGDTLFAVSQRSGISINQLYQYNPGLIEQNMLFPGQTLILSYDQPKMGRFAVNGYAYPFIDKGLLRQAIPYLTYLTPFSYGLNPDGTLVNLDDGELIATARYFGVAPLMHLSTLTPEGIFNNDLAHIVLTDPAVQSRTIQAVLENIQRKDYYGLDVDFEFVYAADALAYAQFISNLREVLEPYGYPVMTALAPKTSATQRGLFYEGHNYAAIGEASDAVLLMTYEWGYTYGPPMAVAPINKVEEVVRYGVSEIPTDKLFLGIPNYGYDWTLPFVRGESRAQSISNVTAINLASTHGAAIQFDATAATPYFNYTGMDGRQHQVWFEDVRSISAKFNLASSYNLVGLGYWNLMRPFLQNWLLLGVSYDVVRLLSPQYLY